MKRLSIALLLLSLLSVARAQLAGPGLSWSGTQGGDVRTFLPSCSNLPVAAVRGESVELRVWGDRLSPFVLLAASNGSQCVPFPGLGNGLILDVPFFLLAVGTLTQTSPCLSCPPGYESLNFALPNAVPPGATLAVQAIGYGAARPSFTAAITGTVR
ncbi:MAG: hypothetical protein R3F56_13405 [Planctomycetota bacterium]